MTEIDRPLSLHAVAKLLVQHKLVEKSDNRGFDRLLGLLKSGEICAVATFPEVSGEPLVISRDYWKKRGPDAMRPLILKNDRGWHGTYTVKLSDVADEAYQKAARGNQGTNPEQLAVSLIRQADTEAVVDVLESEWQRFLKEHELSESDDDDETGGPGRRKKNWEAVYRDLAALLWSFIDDNNVEIPKQEAIASMLVESLKTSGATNLPKATTIKDRLADVRTRVGQVRTRAEKGQ